MMFILSTIAIYMNFLAFSFCTFNLLGVLIYLSEGELPFNRVVMVNSLIIFMSGLVCVTVLRNILEF